MMTARVARSVLVSLLLAACGGEAPPPASPLPGPPPTLPPSMGGAPDPHPAAGAKSGASDQAGPEIDRAVAAIKAGDFKSAKGALERALHKNPKNGMASYYLGVALENLGDRPGAEQNYKDAMTAAPELAEAAVNLGALYLDASKWDEAVQVTERGLAKRPDEPALHANMAVALKGKGDKTGASAEYERAIKIIGDKADLRYGYGALLLEMGNKPKAAIELKAALAAAGGDRALLASIGRLLGSAGAFADCVSALDKAIAAGDDAEFRVRRGLCRHSLKDEPGAKSDFESAAKLDPKFAPAHYYLGEALLASGSAAQAVKEFEAAATLAPQSELGKKARAQALTAKNNGKKSGK
ncbi:MAG TPA: tetratricopeptide repeat protein [Polyangiaceae bacterium]|nr:tetratricopeptide repeat protein [Polyangiaceae bacterium]